ncbi:hypothetical protein AVEN_178923-1 [Araneus ventricosus]|uniref:Uncharacterized protein n=1 Tax=Araneus ventricosus TaxID=182803 RepID=A0A4Y2LTH5_ARAVE|nr:hypothetical protein AVEN_156100-1 [Araneus ventricosus]GBN16836.1 hypothetical protein AVEN_178923-1 [Araneus ventricosus]
MDGSDSVCIFCGNKLENDIVLVEKELEWIIQASLRVDNGLHERLREKTIITVHKSCKQKYTRPSSIRASIKQKETSESAPTTSSVSRSSEEKFDFKNDCFICGKPAVVESKYLLHRRKPVHFVSTLEIRDNVIAKYKNDVMTWGERVKCRLLNVRNPVTPEAWCHKYCYRKFLRTQLGKDIVGRPKSKAFGKLCEYIESSDECQFTVQELQSVMKGFSNCQETYADKYLRNLLKERFKDRLLPSSISGRVNIACSPDTAKKIIDQLCNGKKTDPCYRTYENSNRCCRHY